jgi:hypothetical protein
MTMPAGRYVIIDLCYVMHDVWDECCELFFPAGGHPPRGMEGEFTLKDGRRFASFSTAHGDGTYRSNTGTSHSVDSGSIGCIRIEDIRDNSYDNIEELGAIIEFTEPFKVSNEQGLLTFGYVQIETNLDPWDEDEEHDCFSDEE